MTEMQVNVSVPNILGGDFALHYIAECETKFSQDMSSLWNIDTDGGNARLRETRPYTSDIIFDVWNNYVVPLAVSLVGLLYASTCNI